MKKLLSGAVGLLGYPILSLVALFHGLGIATVWVVKNLGWLVLFPFAAVSISIAHGKRTKNGALSIVAPSYLIAVAIMAMNAIEAFEWLSLSCLFLGIAAANLFSAMYEGGRAYLHRNDKPATSSEEKPVDETPVKPQDDRDDDDLHDKFMELVKELENMIADGFTEEAIMRFIEKVTDIFKDDGIRRKQYIALVQMAEKAKPNAAKEAKAV